MTIKAAIQRPRIVLLLICLILVVAYTAHRAIKSTDKVRTGQNRAKKKFRWHIPAAEYGLDFAISPKGKCEDPNLFLVTMVTSKHVNFEARAAIRGTWGNATSIMGYRIVTLFVIGRTEEPTLQQKLVEESRLYEDIVQIKSYESYDNLTLKTISSLKWASVYCRRATFVMKIDDDMFVNYPRLVRTLADYHQTSSQEKLMLGCVVSWALPERNPGKKWYMDVDIFPRWFYPPYCIGAGYVMSYDVAHKLYKTSLKVPIVQIEDVYLGMCAEKAGIKPRTHPEFSCWQKTTYKYCTFRELLTAHGLKPRDLILLWKDMEVQGDRSCSPREKLLEKVSSIFS